MVNFNPIDKDYIVSSQSDLENTKESILPVCNKPYHKIKENMPLGWSLNICGTIHCLGVTQTHIHVDTSVVNKVCMAHAI